MASPIEIPVTNGILRKMATVADEAAEQSGRSLLSPEHRRAVETVSERTAADCSRSTVVGLLGAADGDAVACTLSLDGATLRRYIDALDAIATNTPTPHKRRACRSVFSHVTGHVDVDAMGLRLREYETLELDRPGAAVFS